MARWKLTRQTYGSEEFTMSEGDEVTIGRGANNTITLSSLVISRQHCVINVFKDKLTVKDLLSSNGTYIGTKKIPINMAVTINEKDILGVGWTEDVSLAKVSDNEKFVFKISKEKAEKSISDRITFQNEENDPDDIEAKFAATFKEINLEIETDNTESKANMKRKLCDNLEKENIGKSYAVKNKNNNDVINLLSDSDSETSNKKSTNTKKVKLEPIDEDINIKTELKTEINDMEYDVFKVKQEYVGYDEEPIVLDSDESDNESEMRWFMRLSQSSPGKPIHSGKKTTLSTPVKESSYSANNDEDFHDSLIQNISPNEEEFSDDMIKLPDSDKPIINELFDSNDDVDEIDNGMQQGISSDYFAKQLKNETAAVKNRISQAGEKFADKEAAFRDDVVNKRAQIIEPIAHSLQKKTGLFHSEIKPSSSSSSSKRGKIKKHSHRKHISKSQKEERKKKLKEIAEKERIEKSNSEFSNSSKSIVNVKVTNSNRGAFLAETTATVLPNKRKESPQKSKEESKESKKVKTQLPKDKNMPKPETAPVPEDVHLENYESTNSFKSKKVRKEHSSRKSNSESEKVVKVQEENKQRIPLKNVKPLSDSEHSQNAGKPISKVEPLPKLKKKVRFSEAPPQVKLFEIEPGNQMKKTSLVKATLLEVPQKPLFSLEKITLMRILRWNPHWLDEQINNNEPPPILGHNSQPLAVLNYFKNHTQYVQVVGDLLLMEIWECVTQAYMRKRGQEHVLQMSLESVPVAPAPDAPDRSLDMFNVNVNLSLPKSDSKSLPRVGELMLVRFGSDNVNGRFFFVHNVRCLPSPPSNKYAFYSISLQTVYTEKMRSLRRGEALLGCSLCYIRNEMALFEAMEYLARSPLSEAILRPNPSHFPKDKLVPYEKLKSPWTSALNESQLEAVSRSVSAALGDVPSIQLVQGPPGTGKSSVICSIVMSYFYETSGRRLQNRGKILICATSNAAVDELVIRLLKIRQNLPKSERFRMVRVGRPEAMHPAARDLSSQALAHRDAQRLQPERAGTLDLCARQEEIGRQEARLNMWRGMVAEAKDPARVAYCQSRIALLCERIAQLGGSCGLGGVGGLGDPPAEALAASERRIVQGADIIVTTLASAAGQKMRGLRRRIALCIVDEAGQAIEPESLIPLTLDVTRLTLVGDPQQLPGFICSQRAKKHGLGESLFSRLSSCMETWNAGSPVVLLNVQYRMHPEIADYPNRAFYAGQIANADNLRADRSDLPLPPYLVICISSGDQGQGASGANEMEAWGVSRVVVALAAALAGRPASLAAVTPYCAHRDVLRRNLRLLQPPNAAPIEVNTIDSFQGQERDVLVVSLARSAGLGFLTDAGRMNVMLTRARRCLAICLNPNALLKNEQWRTLMDDAQRRNLCRYLPASACQPAGPGAAPASPDHILKYLHAPPAR